MQKVLENDQRMWSSYYGAVYGQAALPEVGALSKGMKFRLQHPVGHYIADFVCLEKRLIIELDGGQHSLPEELLRDRQRDAWLEKEGYTVVRFWDNEVLTNTKGVLEVIRERLYRTPSPQGRGSKYPHKMRKNQIKDPHSYAMTHLFISSRK